MDKAETVRNLMEARGDYNVVVHEIEQVNTNSWRAVVSYDWRLNGWEKHVDGSRCYMVQTDSGEYMLL